MTLLFKPLDKELFIFCWLNVTAKFLIENIEKIMSLNSLCLLHSQQGYVMAMYDCALPILDNMCCASCCKCTSILLLCKYNCYFTISLWRNKQAVPLTHLFSKSNQKQATLLLQNVLLLMYHACELLAKPVFL